MNCWPTARLEDCAEIVSGATPRTSEATYWDGDICWATPKDLSELEGAYISETPRKITRSGLQSCAATVLPPESVLFSSRAPIGHVAINVVPMATNQGFKSFVPKRDRIHAKFLYHWLRRNRTYLESLGNGATFKEVSKAIVSRIEVPLPPIPEQRRIAEILDKADALRAMRRAALAQLDTLTQSIFLDMFGDPTVNAKGWPTKVLHELCRGITDIDHKMPVAVEHGVPFVSAKDLTDDGRISFENVKRISQVDFQRLSRKSKPEKGDIIYSRIGVNLGKARVIEVDFDFLASYSCCTIKPNRECVDVTYLCCLLDSPFILRQAHRGVRAIAVPDLGMGEIKAFRIVLPPLKLQREFSRRVGAVEQMKIAHRASLAELDALFATLQHRAFRGELSPGDNDAKAIAEAQLSC